MNTYAAPGAVLNAFENYFELGFATSQDVKAGADLEFLCCARDGLTYLDSINSQTLPMATPIQKAKLGSEQGFIRLHPELARLSAIKNGVRTRFKAAKPRVYAAFRALNRVLTPFCPLNSDTPNRLLSSIDTRSIFLPVSLLQRAETEKLHCQFAN